MLSRKILQKQGVFLICLLAALVASHPGGARAAWLDDLEVYAKNLMEEQGHPGWAMAVVQNDKVVYAKGFGVTQQGGNTAVDADTLFHIGSCSKAFTATQLAMLSDEGKLAWTDLVSKHMPSFRMNDLSVNASFQVEDLLDHRTGLREQALTTMMFMGFSTQDVVRAIRYEKPVTSFRTMYAYQNDMYMAASLLVGTMTGGTWAEDLEAKIFAPLGMSRSVTTQAAMLEKGNTAFGHTVLADGSLAVLPNDWENNFVFDIPQGAGSIRSSVRDMAQWLRFNLARGTFGDQQLVQKTTMKALLVPKTIISPWQQNIDGKYAGAALYAAGWLCLCYEPGKFYYHAGGDFGYTATVGLIFGDDDGNNSAGIVILTNTGADFYNNAVTIAKTQVNYQIASKFYDLYKNLDVSAEAFDQNVQRMRQVASETSAVSSSVAAPRQSANSAASYLGTYANPAYGTFVVSRSGDSLMVSMGPKHLLATLAPTNVADAFTALLPGYPEGFNVNLPVRFENLDAEAPKLILENFEEFAKVSPAIAPGLLLLDK